MNFLGDERKIDVLLPTHIMKVSSGNNHRLRQIYHLAWSEWKLRFEGGETLFGKFNRLACDKFDAAFWVSHVGPLHDGLDGRQRSIEVNIKVCDNAAGYFFHKILTDSNYIKQTVGVLIWSKIVHIDPYDPFSDPRIRIDYYTRGSVDLAADNDIEALHFDQITAVIPGLPGYKEALKEIFNPALRPYCPWEVQEKLDSGKFFE